MATFRRCPNTDRHKIGLLLDQHTEAPGFSATLRVGSSGRKCACSWHCDVDRESCIASGLQDPTTPLWDGDCIGCVCDCYRMFAHHRSHCPAASGRSCQCGTAGRSHLQGVDRHARRPGERRHQSRGFRLPHRAGVHRGLVRQKGQLLFQIDPRPFQAALDQAQGTWRSRRASWSRRARSLSQAEAGVAVAEANQRRVQLDVDRYTPLAQAQAITQQDLDNATQNNMAAKAQLQAAQAQVETAKAQITASTAAVESAKAAVETARINLGFTRLTSPIDGIPGHRPIAGRRAGQSGERRHHDRVDGRSDQGLLHRQRAGVSRLHPPFPDRRKAAGEQPAVSNSS